MADLKIDTSIAQIEDALLREISFALRKSYRPAVADPAELRLQPSLEGGSPTRTDLDLVYVTSIGKRFYWWQESTATDNGTTVIKPSDAGATGRWLLVVSSLLFAGVPLAEIDDGVIKEVILHNGDFDEKVLKARIFGRAPCVAIHFDEELHKAKSQIPGALYDYRVRFELWSVSRNYRDRFEAALGSPIAAEFAEDPGVMRIHGSVKKFLAGSGLGIASVTHTEILGGRLDRAELAERSFVMALNIEVRGSVHNADEPFELTAVDRIDAQRMQSQVGPTGKLDLVNCITLGCDVPLGTGFAKTIAAGTAVIDGAPVTVPSFMNTFTADVSTYRDLAPDGTWTFVEFVQGDEVPDPAAGSMRVGLTVTDSAGIVWDSFVCSTYIPSEDPDQIEV